MITKRDRKKTFTPIWYSAIKDITENKYIWKKNKILKSIIICFKLKILEGPKFAAQPPLWWRGDVPGYHLRESKKDRDCWVSYTEFCREREREPHDTTTELWGLLEITATMAPELATSTDGNKSLEVKLDLAHQQDGKFRL